MGRTEPSVSRRDRDDARGLGETNSGARTSGTLASLSDRLAAVRAGPRRVAHLPFATAGTGVVGFLPRYLEEQGLSSGAGVFWLALLAKAGLLGPTTSAVFAGSVGAVMVGLALWTRRRGANDISSQLRGTTLLLVAFFLLITPTFPWYFLAALPMVPLIGVGSPFALPRGVLMRPDDGGINDQIFKVRIIGHRLEDPPPNPLDAPSTEAPEHAVPIAKRLRKIAPGRAGTHDPQHTFHEHPIVAPGRTFWSGRPMISGAIRSHAASLKTNRSITPKTASQK